MYEIGRLCVKIAGRDAGMKCIIIDVVDEHNVLIDGQTRRRKCNIRHLEPVDQVVKVTKNAPKTEIIRLFKTLNIDVKETKPKKKAEKPKKSRKKKLEPAKRLSKEKTKASSKETKTTKSKIESKKEKPDSKITRGV